MPSLMVAMFSTDEAFLMQRGDGRILVSFYKGVHSHTDASEVPDEPGPDAFAGIGSQASCTNTSRVPLCWMPEPLNP